MIENIEQLIEQANLITSETERVNFVMNYFYETVQYDYAYLVADGYMQGTISMVNVSDDKKRPFLVDNPFKKGKLSIKIDDKEEEFTDFFCTTYEVTEGSSDLLNKIVSLTSESKGDKKEFLLNLSNLLSKELHEHLNNDDLVTSNIHKLIEKINQDMGKGKIMTLPNEKYFISNDIKKVLLSYILNPNDYFPPVIENGILKSGVCQHYADYLEELLPKIGIDAVRIDGTSEMGHAWIAAIIDGNLKSIDLTRAIFIRDGFKGIPAEQKSSDWLISDFEDTFKMQSTRTITDIGMNENHKPIPLPYIMNGNNFDKELVTERVIKQCNQNYKNK